jgi:hypothetical protein
MRLHGMARIAWDESSVYLNGAGRTFEDGERELVAALCAKRRLDREDLPNWERPATRIGLLKWLRAYGAFQLDV